MSKGRKFAVFDIDGTLIRWQLYHAVVERLARNGLVGEDSLAKLHQARMVWKRREHVNSFSDYEKALIAIYEEALPTLKAVDFDATAQEIALKYKEQVYRFTRDLAAKLKKDGYFLLAISGSHEELVAPIAQQHGFDDWVGSRFERHEGKFSGQYFFAAGDKKAILDELVTKHGLSYEDSYAVGDSKSDAPLLASVENPVAFNPDQTLFELANKNGWPVVVERKNMIYKLEPINGRYVLAETN